MVADFFTKPLQGNLFRRLRDVILGHKHISTVKEYSSEMIPIQERVGENDSYETVMEDRENTSLEVDGNTTVSWADIVQKKL